MSCKELEKVTIREDVDRYFQVRIQLLVEDKRQLVDFLKHNLDVFAWNAYEALRVDLEFICHQLNINPDVAKNQQLSSSS